MFIRLKYKQTYETEHHSQYMVGKRNKYNVGTMQAYNKLTGN